MCILNNQLPVNLIAIADKFVAPSLVAVLQSASPLFGVVIKVLIVRTTTPTTGGMLPGYCCLLLT